MRDANCSSLERSHGYQMYVVVALEDAMRNFDRASGVGTLTLLTPRLAGCWDWISTSAYDVECQLVGNAQIAHVYIYMYM
jgi:hypothetical protein